MIKKILTMLIVIVCTGVLGINSTSTVEAQNLSSTDTGGITYLPLVLRTIPVEDWIGPNGGRIIALAISEINPDVIYAGTWGSGVFKSTDGGATWTAMNNGLDTLYIQSIAVSPDSAHANYVYAGTYKDGLYRSTDGGETWNDVNDDIADETIVYSIAIDPESPKNVFLATRGESNNGDEPWNGLIYKSGDYGASWNDYLGNIGVGDNIDGNDEDWAYSISVDPDDHDKIYIATHSTGPWYSTDEGDTWQKGYSTTPTSVSSYEVSIVGRAILALGNDVDDVFYGAWTSSSIDGRGGVFRSTDDGTPGTWGWRSDGVKNISIFNIAADSVDKDNMFVGTVDHGVYKTTDYGDNWTGANSGFNATEDVYSLVINPDDPSILYAGTGGDGLYKTTDAAETWVESDEGLTGSPIASVVPNPTYPDIVLASFYQGGVFQSWDGGDSWTNITAGTTMQNRAIHGLVIDPGDPTKVFALTNEHGLKTISISTTAASLSADQSYTWEDSSSGLSAVTPDQPEYGSGYSFDSAHPFAGQTITDDDIEIESSVSTESTDSFTSVLSMVFDPNNTEYALLGTGGDGVYRSTDGGSNWTSIGLDGYDVYSVLKDYSGIIYAAINDDYSLRYSTNNGSTWRKAAIPSGDTVYSLAISTYDQSTIYAGTSDGLYRSTSGSNVWEQVTLDGTDVNSVAVDPNYGYGTIILAGTEDSAYISYDNGDNWVKLSDALDGLSVQSVAIGQTTASNNRTMFMGTQTSGIFRVIQ